MKKSATLISTYWQGIISLCRSNVRNFLTMLFLLSGTLFVTQKSDAQCNSFGVSFTQGANRDNFKVQGVPYGTGELHWINSILQGSNSRYIEGMSTMQRVVFDNLPSCGGNHVLRIKMESRKGDIHAYDFLTSWDNALKAAAQIAPGFGLMPANRADPKLHECDAAIGSCSEDACNLVTGGGNGVGDVTDDFRDLPIIFSNFANPVGPGEGNLLIEGPPADQNTTRQVIETYECRYGDNIVVAAGPNAGTYHRSVRVYVDGGFLGGSSNGDANNAVYFVGYGDSNPNDGGDTYIYYDIKWSSTSSSVVLEFAAHIAVGVDGLAAIDPDECNVTSLGVGYLLNRGASSISGGPYHVILENFQDALNNTPHCEPNLGNQDNQLQGSEILLIPECDLQGPSAVCGDAIATYTATVTNPDNATNAANATFLWEIINSSQSPPPNPAAATINGAASGNVPQVPAGQTSVPLSITVNTGGVGSYTVKLTITNGAATTTTDDNITSSCTVTTTVSGAPSLTCPTSTATAACQTQAQVDAAYVAWLGTVTCSGTMSHNGGTVGPDKCGGAKTVVFTCSNTCGTATCSATFTVTADNTAPVLTTGGTGTTLGCNPSAGDINGALGTATASDACGAPTISVGDGSVSSNGCGRSQTRTWTARDACNNTSTASRTVTWTADGTPPVITTGGGSCSLGCNPSAGDINACLGTATATDACGVPTVTSSDGSVTSDGCSRSQTRTFTARDACGNTSTASRTATWTADVTGPTITSGGGSLTLGCNPSAGDINTSLGTATATDACSVPTVTSSDGPVGSNGCGRSQTRTFTARDFCGNTSTASRTVTWTADVTPPVITSGGGSCSLGCNPSAGDINACLGTATATDACGVPTVTSSDGSVTSDGCSRSQTRTFTARDDCGNTSTASRTATWIADGTPPVITTGGTTTTLGCNPSAGDINGALGTATATDNCGVPTLSSSDGTVVTTSCGRSQTRTWTARDACGNTSTASRTVTWSADNTPPNLVTGGGSCTLGCNPSASDINACLGTASASDACSTPTISQSDGSVSSNGCSRSQTRTWTARDACGNTSTASRTATWTSDLTPPTITCGNNKTIECGTPIVFDNPTATDNCDTSPAIETVSTSGDGLTRTWRATDDCGNTATCSQTLTIGDCVENIFPTGTTCEQFQAQNTPTTESLCFSQNNGIVANASAPGAWFYYTYVVKPAGVSTISVRINQTNDGVIAGLFTSDEIKAWTAACTQITRRVTRDFSDPAHPVITIEFVGGAVNSALTLVISAKYNSQSIVGSAVTGTSSVYSFSASRSLDNGAFSVIGNSQESITANECNANLLTVARPPSELVTDQPANQLRVSAYPNPFTDVVRFTINSNISGQAQLEVVNMAGQRIAVVYNGHIEANRNRVVEYKISTPVQQTLIYILRMGGKQVTGKVIKLE